VLVDTNVLLRAAQPSHPMHASAVRALAVLMEREEPVAITIQNVAEFWKCRHQDYDSNFKPHNRRKHGSRKLDSG
jgi:predicted nucleic acid-binding protein